MNISTALCLSPQQHNTVQNKILEFERRMGKETVSASSPQAETSYIIFNMSNSSNAFMYCFGSIVCLPIIRKSDKLSPLCHFLVIFEHAKQVQCTFPQVHTQAQSCRHILQSVAVIAPCTSYMGGGGRLILCYHQEATRAQ